MGQQSILHAVKARNKPMTKNALNSLPITEESQEEHEPSKPLSQTLTDLQLETTEREKMPEEGMSHKLKLYSVNLSNFRYRKRTNEGKIFCSLFSVQ